MWELDCEERWAPKYWCFWTESSLDCKEMQPVHSKGDQSWVFFGRTDAKAETPILWPFHVKSWLIGKVSDAGRDWGQEEKGTTEDEMAGWHYRLDGHEFEWTPGVGDGQRGLACCDSWVRKESDTTEQLNWTEEVRWTRRPWTSFYLSGPQQHHLQNEWKHSYSTESGMDKRNFMVSKRKSLIFVVLFLQDDMFKNLRTFYIQLTSVTSF